MPYLQSGAHLRVQITHNISMGSIHHDTPRFGERDQIVQFLFGILGVDGRDHRSGEMDAEIGERPFRAIVGKESDAIAGMDARLAQNRCRRDGALPEFAVGDARVGPLALDLERRLLRNLLCPLFEPICQHEWCSLVRL